MNVYGWMIKYIHIIWTICSCRWHIVAQGMVVYDMISINDYWMKFNNTLLEILCALLFFPSKFPCEKKKGPRVWWLIFYNHLCANLVQGHPINYIFISQYNGPLKLWIQFSLHMITS
jgi:hypothetical protein